MKINLKSTKDLDSFEASNESGHKITLGAKDAVGPMQSVLMAAAGCSTIDIVMILKKMRQDLQDIEVEVEAKRREEIPKTFTHIHLHYKLYGKIKEEKAKQAVDSSLEKYCSVTKMLSHNAEISSSFSILEK